MKSSESSHGPAARDTPLLSPRRMQAAALTAVGLTSREIAQEMGISVAAVLHTLRAARLSVGAQNLRVLSYMTLATRQVDLSRLPDPPPGLLDEPQAHLVLSSLRYDVPDHHLMAAIALRSTTPETAVEEILHALRSTLALNTCGLIGLSFAAGILTGLEGVTPPPGAPGCGRVRVTRATVMAALHQKGKYPLAYLADLYTEPVETVRLRLEDAGVTIDAGAATSPAAIADAVAALYELELSVKLIARHCRISTWNVSNTLRKRGVRMRPMGPIPAAEKGQLAPINQLGPDGLSPFAP